MVTTQFQVDEDTFEALRKFADKQKKPISIVAGEMLKNILTQPQKPMGSVSKESFTFIGSGSSNERDLSVNHNKYLEDAYL